MCKRDEKISSLVCFDIKLLYGRCAEACAFSLRKIKGDYRNALPITPGFGRDQDERIKFLPYGNVVSALVVWILSQ